MAIEKMHFVNIAGPLNQIDNFVVNTIVPYNVQLLNAFSILDTVKGLYPFSDPNPYSPLLKRIESSLIDESISDMENYSNDEDIDLATIESQVDELEKEISDLLEKKKLLIEDIKEENLIRKQISLVKNIDFEIDKLFKMKYMKFRFGKVPKTSFDKLQLYAENLDVVMLKVYEEEEDVYLMYFMPRSAKENMDSLFASLYFERIRLAEEIKGCPKEALEKIDKDILDLEYKLDVVQEEITIFHKKNNDKIIQLYYHLNRLNQVFDVRKHAVHSKEAFYLTGWIADGELESFMDKIKGSRGVSCIVEDDDAVKKTTPPTKLKNARFFKPFEAIVSMYGTPSYTEIDPTIYVGITYLLMFGMMFGDVGQGLVLATLSYIFYRKSKNSLGILGIYLGVTSSFFGLFYGSIFGNEEFLRHHLSFIPMINPMESKMIVLGGAVVFGIVLILSAMGINIINHYKNKKYGRLFLDRNGVVGLVFYIALLYYTATLFTSADVSLLYILGLMVVPLIIIFFAHPLENLIEGKKNIFPEDKSGFFIESFFEILETILAILSNTISFMRVGAFALNHVGFFLAFRMLSTMVGGAGSIFITILGNVLIIFLEGLIVAIQGLRLEYYELFSRFFNGDGQPFKPFAITKQ